MCELYLFQLEASFPLDEDLSEATVDPPLKAFEVVGLNFAFSFPSRKSPISPENSY